MEHSLKAVRLETEALVIGYAMSRLDEEYMRYRKLGSWQAAYEEAALALSVRSLSFRNLRDEFDPFHSNKRLGWHKRPIMPSRQKVLEDFKDVSDDALKALVDRIILRDLEATAEAIDSLAVVPSTAHNVAERLLTGRKAEEYFLDHCEPLIGIKGSELLDHRQLACGFDFSVRHLPQLAIEVKGMKRVKGESLFTDREWTEANFRGKDYWLVVIGNLESAPQGKVVHNPYDVLETKCSYQVTVAASWRSRFSVAC
ncbi:MAG: DUF3883 domain-containing protein [Pirellulales bacterium]